MKETTAAANIFPETTAEQITGENDRGCMSD
jgi:hypothetical protein